jgi:hypothetical protein
MLLYDTDEGRDESAADYINQALKRGQLAVYASVHANDTAHMDRISSKIPDFKVKIERGDLLIVRLRSFYERALIGDLEPFYDLKAILEAILEERVAAGKTAGAVVVADCAGTLSRDEKFDECIFVERWWHNTHSDWLEKNVRINVVCPYASAVFGQKPFMHHEQQISRLHSITVSTLSK